MPFIALGVSMIIVDATIVNVAVPTIIRELHVGANTTEWFNSIYSLVFASLLITLGHTGDVRDGGDCSSPGRSSSSQPASSQPRRRTEACSSWGGSSRGSVAP
ncbi:MAG TPA: hypothetical protein VFC03_08490 [Acidimicrobiales bacterium]|nr:hypothetical protein [Acidimicrobiales bacterium]